MAEIRWIKVNEALPKEDQVVLIVLKMGSGWTLAVGSYANKNFYYSSLCRDFDDIIPIEKVIAWMSLPEPYTKEFSRGD